VSYNPSGLADMLTYTRGQESVVVPIWRQVAGEFPFPDFRVLRDIYLNDPDMYSAVNFVANRALSRGYHIECNENVPGHEDAEEFLEDWLDAVRWGDRKNERGYGPLLRIITRELGWGGTSLLETLEPDSISAFAQVQLSSVWKFQRDDVGQLTAIWQYMSINPRALTPDRYLLFGWNTVDRNPFSYGLIHSVSLAKPNMISGGTIPPLIAIKWQMEHDMAKRMHRAGSPRAIFQTKALAREEVKPLAEALRDPTADATFVTNAEVGVAMDSPTARMNFGPDLDFIDGRIKAATGNVLAEMLTGKGFSYASAVKAGSLADELVWDMQSVIKADTQNAILKPVLDQNGFDGTLLNPKFEFNIPDNPQEWTMADLITAYLNGAITQADFVRNAKQFGKWDLDEPAMLGPSPAAPFGPAPGANIQNPGAIGTPGANVPNPGQLVTQPDQGLDPVAMRNLAQIQSFAAGAAGAASAVQGVQRKGRPRLKYAAREARRR